MFLQVQKLPRLWLVYPITINEYERSFSTLRRLKTWLKNSLCQAQYIYEVKCNIRKHELDGVVIERWPKNSLEKLKSGAISLKTFRLTHCLFSSLSHHKDILGQLYTVTNHSYFFDLFFC